MGTVANTRSSFVIYWTLAGLWLPLLLGVGWAMVDRSSGPKTEIYVLGGLGTYTLLIMALSQWCLLVGRVPRAWLWIVAGVAAVIVEQLVYLLLFYVSLAVFNPFGEWLYYVARIIAAGFAIAATQAVALHYWRLDGKSWFGLSFAAFLGGFIVKALSRDYLIPVLGAADSSQLEFVQNLTATLLQWFFFGTVTGWYLWRRLSGRRVGNFVPA